MQIQIQLRESRRAWKHSFSKRTLSDNACCQQLTSGEFATPPSRGCPLELKTLQITGSLAERLAYFNSSLRVIRFLAAEFTRLLPDDFMMALLNCEVSVEISNIEL
jgi:hypothetical protein